MAEHRIICGKCGQPLYPFKDVVIVTPDNDLVVRPEVARRPNANVGRQDNPDGGGGYALKSLYCRKCGENFGRTQSESISQTMTDRIHGKSVKLEVQGQGTISVNRWEKHIELLKSRGVQSMTSAELAEQAGGKYTTRGNLPVYPTILVDVDNTPEKTLTALLAKKTPRNYQLEMIQHGLKRNSLVCLPTGSGKTLIAAGIIAAMLHINPKKVVAFVVKTNPLAEQQSQALADELPKARILTYSGQMDPEMKAKSLKKIGKFDYDVLVITCDCMNILVEYSTVRIEDLCCLVLDEAHHSKKNDPYNILLKKIYEGQIPEENRPLVLGLTASPVDEKPKGQMEEALEHRIVELSNSLGCVASYPLKHDPYKNGISQTFDVASVRSEDTEELRFRRQLDEYLFLVLNETTGLIRHVSEKFAHLQELASGSQGKFDTNVFRGTLREVEKELDKQRDLRTSEYERETIQKGYAIRNHLNQILAVHEINNVIGHQLAKSRMREIFDEIEDPSPGQQKMQNRVLYETGVNGKALYAKFHEKLKSEPKTDDFGEHMLSQVCKKIRDLALEHYKKHKTNSRILVFVDMRRTAKKLSMVFHRMSEMRTLFNPKEIVGRGLQSDGLTIDEQQEILKEFRKGFIKLLISTTILEEGLDVTQCNMVIRLSAPQTLRQFIQSRGRACRAKDGIFHIICKDQDELDLQLEFLTCVQKQPEIVKRQMQQHLNYDSMQKQGHELKVLDLDEDPGREDNVLEPDLNETEQEDEDIEELMRLVCESEMQPEQEDDLRFLDEFEPGEVALSLQFVWWCKDDPEKRRKVHYPKVQDIICRWTESVLQGEWKDQELDANTLLLGTKYYPEAKFASVDAKGVEEIELYEKNMIGGLFMSSSLDSKYYDFWVSVKTPHCYFPKSTALRLSLKGVNVGSLVTPKKFICHSPLGATARLLVDRASDHFSITINDNFKIDASFADIQSFIVVDKVNSEDKVQDPIIRLHFTFNQPPRFSTLPTPGVDSRKKDSHRICHFNQEDTRLILGNCLTYQLEVPNLLSETKTRLLEPRIRQVLRVMESCGKTIYYSHLTMESAIYPVPNEYKGLSREFTIHHASRDVNYAMKCVQSAKGFMHERLDYNSFFNVLDQVSEEKATNALYQLAEVLDKIMFCDYTTQLITILNKFYRQPAIARTNESKNHRYMKRVIITPTRLIFFKPDFIQTNRTVRRNGAENFIRVGIRDENCDNLTMLYGELTNVMSRVSNILTTGIKIGDVDYHYLASSSSQLRGHACYFIEDRDHNTANRIRAEQGNLSEITKVGKYVARMGLGFSTSEKTIEVRGYETEEDIKRGGYTFSDGIGLIAESIAQKVRDKLKLETLPSAFQIRLGGCKGMLVVWKDEFLRSRDYLAKVIIRESMHKFPSDHMSLEVLEKTKPLQLHLNHQVIMLLNNVGVQSHVFMDLLRKDISELGRMFSEETAAHEVLRSLVAEQVRDLEPVKFKFTTDAYFRQLMMAFYRVKMKDLRERSRVRIDPSKARVLIGVLDEAAVLQPGEVFIQISENLAFPEAAKRAIRSEIVIMKNPCIHPGDVRTFRGVDKPELRHLFDCVVFPQRGSRPHPNELSGSDLDGDQYHCIWDPDLLPQIPIKDPMDYKSSGEMKDIPDIGVKHMIDYTCKYIQNDTLGMIDNTHKALADQFGLEHEECLKLAEVHAKAVDAPKTGDWQQVPEESRKMLKKYPDFMMKRDKPSYPSSNVLGEMFRECNKYISNSVDPLSEGVRGEVIADGAFEAPNHEEFYQDAQFHYRNYCDRLQTVMTMYGIKTEAELVSGHINHVHSRLTEELDDVIRNSKILMRNITDEYQKIFFNDPRLDVPDREAKEIERASAWYLIAYGRQERDEITGLTPTRFLSFAWIVSKVLAKIFVHNTTKAGLPLKSPELTISKSIGALYSDVIDDVLATLHKHKQLCGRIAYASQRFGVCYLSGMTSTLLFDRQYGEVSILMMKKPGKNKYRDKDYRLSFLKSLRTELRPMTAQEALDSSTLHLRIELKDHSLAKKRAEVTTDELSMYIWATIVAYIKQDHWLHPVLRLLCSWIRNTGLVGGRKMFLPDYLIPCLFIDHCLHEKVIKPINIEGVNNDCLRFLQNPNTTDHPLGSIKSWEELCKGLSNKIKCSRNPRDWEKHASRTGDLLIKFMKQGKEQISRSVHPSFAVCLNIKKWGKIDEKEKLDLLISEMEKASHRLVMHVSAGCLLKTIKIEKLFFLKLEAARRLAGNEDSIAKTLHMKCGAVIDIQTKMSDRNKNSGMIVTATGNEAELYLLDKEIKLLNRKLKVESKLTRSVRVLGMRDLPGAHNLLIDGANSEDKCSIRLEPYYGLKYPQHDYKNLHIVRLFGSSRSALQSSQVDSPVACSFRKHFERQLKNFDNKFSEAVYGDCELQIKFGRAYVVSPPRSFTEDAYGLTVDDLLRTLENRKTRELDPTWESVTRRKQSMYSARNNNEGSISTSFVSSITYTEDFQDKVKALTKKSKPIKTEIGAKMVVEQASGSVTARYQGEELNFVGIETSPFRWVVSDIKRHCNTMESNVEGDECDIRFLMKTQLKEVDELGDHAQNWGFEDALGRDKDKKIMVKNSELDIKFIEDYQVAIYEMQPTPLGVPYNAMVRESTQYTRKIGVEGKMVTFTSIKTLYELRLLPDVSYLVNFETRNDTLDSLWELAFQYSNFLKAYTKERSQ